MIDHRTLGVWTAGGTALTRVDALVTCADEVLSTLGVTSTSTLAAISVADLMGLTLLISSAKEYTVAAKALLSDGAMFVKSTLRLAATVDTDVLIGTVDGRKAHSH